METSPNFLRICDSREPPEVYEPLLKSGWFKTKLQFGDFQFYSQSNLNILITRKSWEDLLQSIGEVFNKQLDEILTHNSEGVNIILLEGKPQRETTSDRMVTSQGLSHHTFESAFNYITSWQDRGFRLQITFSTAHTVQRLNELYLHYQKPFTLSHNSKVWNDDRIPAFPTYTRGSIALKALARWQSLAGVATAGLKELQEELGSKRGQLVHDHFHRR